LEGVAKSYGELKVFDDVTLSFSEGLIHGVIAPNGYGKTTLLRIMLGIVKPDKGKAIIRANKVSYLPQDSEPIGVMTAKDFLISYLVLRGYSFKVAKEKAEEFLRFFGIHMLRDKPVDDVSGGQKQRVLLVAVMAYDADLYVLDEPLTYLDIEGTTLLKGIIKKLKDQGKTIIISSPLASNIIDVLMRS